MPFLPTNKTDKSEKHLRLTTVGERNKAVITLYKLYSNLLTHD